MMYLPKYTKDLKQFIFYSNKATENCFYHVFIYPTECTIRLF